MTVETKNVAWLSEEWCIAMDHRIMTREVTHRSTLGRLGAILTSVW